MTRRTARSRYFFMTLLLISSQINAETISDFKSDGCSHFPDGTLKQEALWCECCIAHDIAYWQGGTLKQKQAADQTLRDCVSHKTNNPLLADTMYYGVTLGGLPVYPVWYRWGFGWSYGRGFKPLSQTEQQQIAEKLQRYKASDQHRDCDFEYPLYETMKQGFDTILE